MVCVWAAGIISGLLGFKTSYLPPPDTRVGFIYTGQQVNYIIASYPTALPVPNLERGVTDPELEVKDQQTYAVQRNPDSRMANSHNPPTDLLEGEINIDNIMGVGLSLLRNLASVQAGDLARVECHLMDELVRIISQNYRHHSAFGDFKITNDGGKLNVEWNGTSYDHEAWGVKEPRDAKVDLDEHGDHIAIEDTVDGYKDDGRWRFSQYIGWLGDFIHFFVSDPVDQIGRLASDQLRGGKARMHVNADGSVLIQSVADIVLEKVVRIPVPIRIRRDEDPEGNRSDEGLRNQQELTQWRPSDQSNIFEMAFQLREYARWMNNQHAFARFRQMDRDYRVPTESETPSPKLNSSEKDKEDVNQGVTNWRLGYACYRIYRDGSVQHVDAYGNSYTSTKTGIQISSTQDILLQAAGSVNIMAGRDINLVAKKNIGLTAVSEKLRLKAKNGIWALIESGKFLVDFVNVGVAYFKNAKLNVNNVVSTTVSGNLDVAGTVTGTILAASITLVADDHDGHIYPGIPSPDETSDAFEFQSDYGPTSLYQTHAQSALDRGEQEAGGEWNLAENEVSGKGAPWPGVSPTEKKAPGGESLQTPTAADATSKPAEMVEQSAKMKVQA